MCRLEEMFEILKDYISAMKTEKGPKTREGYTNDMVDNQIKNPIEVSKALKQGAPNKEDPSILTQLVIAGDVRVLEAIVNIGAFKDLDLNDDIFKNEGKSLIELCADAMQKNKELRDNYNRIYQILLYGGIETVTQEIYYNTRKKANLALEGAAGVAEGAVNVAAATAGAIATMGSVISDMFSKVSEVTPESVKTMGALLGAVGGMSYDALLEAYRANVPDIELDAEVVDAIQKALGDKVLGATDMVSALYTGTWDLVAKVDTRIQDPQRRSQLSLKDEEDRAAFVRTLPFLTIESIRMSIFLLNKDLENTKLSYKIPEFQTEICENLASNPDPEVAKALLNDIFAKAEISQIRQAEMVCQTVVAALKGDNIALADSLLLYYKAKNRTSDRTEFWTTIENNQSLKDALEINLTVKENKQALENTIGLLLGTSLEISFVGTDPLKEILANPKISKQALANHKFKNQEGKDTTLLHELVRYGNPDLNYITMFVQNGADVNALDEDGNTPFHYAAQALAKNDLTPEAKANLEEIIKVLVYGDLYGVAKDFGHNVGAKTEGTMLQGVGGFFRAISGADMRKLTSEQADLSKDKDAIINMVRLLTPETLDFVMFYLVKRWPHKLVEWEAELMEAARANGSPVTEGIVDKTWKFAGYEVAPKSVVELMNAHIGQARENKKINDEQKNDFLTKPGRLATRLRELNKGKEEVDFKGFYKVGKDVQDDKIGLKDAIVRYHLLVDTYYYARSAEERAKIETFKQVITDLLSNGITTQDLAIPEPKDISDVICDLAEEMYNPADNKRQTFQNIIRGIDLTGITTLQEKGKKIIADLRVKGYKRLDQTFVANVTNICNEQPELLRLPKNVWPGESVKFHSASITRDEVAKPVVSTPAVPAHDMQKSKLDEMMMSWDKVKKPEWSVIESAYATAMLGFNLGANAEREYETIDALAVFIRSDNVLLRDEKKAEFLIALYAGIYNGEKLDKTVAENYVKERYVKPTVSTATTTATTTMTSTATTTSTTTPPVLTADAEVYCNPIHIASKLPVVLKIPEVEDVLKTVYDALPKSYTIEDAIERYKNAIQTHFEYNHGREVLGESVSNIINNNSVYINPSNVALKKKTSLDILRSVVERFYGPIKAAVSSAPHTIFYNRLKTIYNKDTTLSVKDILEDENLKKDYPKLAQRFGVSAKSVANGTVAFSKLNAKVKEFDLITDLSASVATGSGTKKDTTTTTTTLYNGNAKTIFDKLPDIFKTEPDIIGFLETVHAALPPVNCDIEEAISCYKRAIDANFNDSIGRSAFKNAVKKAVLGEEFKLVKDIEEEDKLARRDFTLIVTTVAEQLYGSIAIASVNAQNKTFIKDLIEVSGDLTNETLKKKYPNIEEFSKVVTSVVNGSVDVESLELKEFDLAPAREAELKEPSALARVLKVLGWGAVTLGSGAFAYAIYQGAGIVAPKLPELPEKAAGFIADLPEKLKFYGPMAASAVVGGLIYAFNPKVGKVSNIIPNLLLLGSATQLAFEHFGGNKEYKPAAITFAATAVGALIKYLMSVSDKEEKTVVETGK